MRFVDKNGNGVPPIEELYCNKENFLRVGDYIKGRKNRYRVVYKELDMTYAGERWNIDVTIDNR